MPAPRAQNSTVRNKEMGSVFAFCPRCWSKLFWGLSPLGLYIRTSSANGFVSDRGGVGRGRVWVTGALEGPTCAVVASIVLAGIVRPALAVLILFSPDSTSDF